MLHYYLKIGFCVKINKIFFHNLIFICGIQANNKVIEAKTLEKKRKNSAAV